ncbi:putative AttH domain-containing protein [Seiridium unicorne]|uniref:AttH domain-containing protein n=1 Tax=Seiridium unicorne TaxID=138068 RepID=A0ABR2UMC7_9PEZI
MARLNYQTAYQKADEIEFSTSSADPLAAWRISGTKGQAWEQWYFDSVADDGKSSIVLTMARDGSYAALGKGVLRVELDVTFDDGTHYNRVDWMQEAVVEDRSANKGKGRGTIDGVWTAAHKSYRYQIAADGSAAKVEIDTPEVQGHFTLAALSPPVYPGGETQEELDATGKQASTELLPKIHLVQVMPTATFEGDLMVRGRLVRFRGIGGHMHAWAQGSWFDTTLGWRVARGVAGPFSVTVMEYTDMDGVVHTSGFVAEDGRKRLGGLDIHATPKSSSAAQRALKYRDDEEGREKPKRVTVRWTPTYNTGLTGRFADASSGAILHFTSGERDEEYRFELTHRRKAFEFLFGSNDTGLTAFMGEIKGGKVGGSIYRGVQFSDVCVLPLQDEKDIIVKVHAAGLCGSDLHMFRGLDQGAGSGFIMGHEFSGTVVAVGSAVKTVRVHDKVVSPFTVSCGDCFYCNTGSSSRCSQCQVFGTAGLDGAQSEYVRVPLADSTVIPAPTSISDDALVLMADVFPTAFFGARNAFTGLGNQCPTDVTVVVIGCGPVGLCAIVSALEYRPRHIFAVDQVDSRLAIAKSLGAEPLHADDGESLIERVSEVTEGRGADIVIEVVGASPALRTAYDVIPFTAEEGYNKNLKIQMGRCPVRSVFEDALEVLVKKQHVLGFMYDNMMPLSAAVQGYDLFSRMGAQKVIFKP